MADKSKYDSQSGGNTSEDGDQNGNTDYKQKYEEVQSLLEKKEKEYVGLQGTVQKKDDLLKEAQAKFAELTGTHSQVQSDLAKLAADKETLSSTLGEKEKALVTYKTQAERAKIIMGEYPELAIFEAKGLLPQTGPDDDESKMKALFGNFKTTMDALRGETASKTKADLLAGAGAKQPGDTGLGPSGSTDPAAQHLAEYTKQSLVGNTKLADAAFALYQEAKYKGKPVDN